jgi:hypothetical protein
MFALCFTIWVRQRMWDILKILGWTWLLFPLGPLFWGVALSLGVYIPRQNQDYEWMLQNQKLHPSNFATNKSTTLIRTILFTPLFKPSQVFHTPNCPPPNPTPPSHPIPSYQCFSQEEQISSVFPQKQLRKFWKLFFLYCKFH